MARYIDADALIERIQKLKVVTDDMYGMGIARGIERAETAIEMTPTADVVPKSEVARIFEEIEKHLFVIAPIEEFDGWAKIQLCDLLRIKKKYTEGNDE